MRLTFATCFLALAGCGDSGLGTGGAPDLAKPDLAMTDLAVPPDLTPPPDLRVPADLARRNFDAAGVLCGPNATKACGMSETCCATLPDGGMVPNLMCQKSCGDAGIPILCDGPEDCKGGTPACCTRANLGGMGFNCTVLSASASCEKTCDFDFPIQGCPGMLQILRCHQAADCAGSPGTPNCCEIMGVAGCVPDQAKQLPGIKCL